MNDFDKILQMLLDDKIDYNYIYNRVTTVLFTRKELKMIFEGTLYKQIGSDRYRNEIMKFIICKYKEMDDCIDKKIENVMYKNLIEQNATTTKDNVYVLVNLLYEETIAYDVIKNNDEESFINLFCAAIEATGMFLQKRIAKNSKLIDFLTENNVKLEFKEK